MYSVIRYFNYHKGVSFTILRNFNCFKKANTYALRCAKDEFGKELVMERHEYTDVVIDGYTKGNSYDEFIYGVIERSKLNISK